MRRFAFSLCTATLILGTLPAAAQAQEISADMQERERAIIELIVEAEIFAGASNCELYLARLDAASRALDGDSLRPGMTGLLRQRIFEVRQRGCYPAPPPPPPAPSTVGAEYTAIVDRLNADFDRAMDRAARARVERNCEDHDAKLAEALAAAEAARSAPLGEAGDRLYEGMLGRIRDERARGCGPQAGPPEEGPETQILQQRREYLINQARQRQIAEDIAREAREAMDVQRMTMEQNEANRQMQRAFVQVFGTYGENDVPSANFGFQRDGAAGTAPERPAAFSTERVETFGFGFGLQIGALSFNLGYTEGEASNRTGVPASTTGGARGYPYTDNAPSDSTGIGGNVALDVDTEVSLNAFAPRIGYSWDVGGRGATVVRGSYGHFFDQPYDNLILFNAFADGLVGDRDHRGVVSITTPVIATQTLDQDLDELELGITVGFQAFFPIGGGAHVSIGGEVGVYAYDYDLSSLETNAQNFGPAADRAFTVRLDDSESGIGYRGAATAELGIGIGRDFELFVAGEARYQSHRAQVVNPFSGDFVLAGGTSFLDTDNTFDWRISLGLRMQLRGPNFRF